CPSDASRSAASRTADRQARSTGVSNGGSAVQAIRSGPGSRPTSSMNGRDGTGAAYGAPGTGPDVTSSRRALSATVRGSACSTARPAIASPLGAQEFRPRVGLSPKTPQHEAGIRIEPAPSLPWAAGTIRDATAAADPPDEPPVVRSGAHGLRAGPNRTGSLV